MGEAIGMGVASEKSGVHSIGSATTAFDEATYQRAKRARTSSEFGENEETRRHQGGWADRDWAGEVPEAERPKPEEVVVIQLGSHYTRLGKASDPSPKTISTVVAFKRDTPPTNPPTHQPPKLEGVFRDDFDQLINEISLQTHLEERRRGGGKPIPWSAAVDSIGKAPPVGKKTDAPHYALVGFDTARLPPLASYDLIRPIWRGRLNTVAHSLAQVRSALQELYSFAIEQSFAPGPRPGKGSLFAILVVPEEACRADVREMVDVLFADASIRAVFVHHASVCAAFGAGLSTCVVVDLGHSNSYIACIDEGIVVPESRTRLLYGGTHVSAVLRRLLKRHKAWEGLEPSIKPSEINGVVERIKEELCTAESAENDVLQVSVAHTSAWRTLQTRVGLGPLVSASWGLFYPRLLNAAAGRAITELPRLQGDDADSAFLDSLVDDSNRTVRGQAAKPLGYFQPLEDNGLVPLDDAVALSVKRTVEVVLKNDTRRRLLGAILMVGGCSEIKGIGSALEVRVRNRLATVFPDASKESVDVLVGGKDMPASTLAWLGGAVSAQAESVHDMWISKREWVARDSRAIRERSAFFW